MAEQKRRPSGRPVGILSGLEEKRITEMVMARLQSADAENKDNYRAALEEFHKHNMRLMDRAQLRLTFQSIPQYMHCVGLTPRHAIECLGYTFDWPSDEMKNICERLELLPQDALFAALDLAKRLAPDFLFDQAIMATLQQPRSRLTYIREHRPDFDSSESNIVKRMKTRINLRLSYQYTFDTGTILEMIQLFNLSPAWVFGWTDVPVLASKAEIEQIIAFYSFLGRTVKKAFSQFLDEMSSMARENKTFSIPMQKRASAKLLSSAIAGSCGSEYMTTKNRILSLGSSPDNWQGYKRADAFSILEPLVNDITDSFLENPAIAGEKKARIAHKLNLSRKAMGEIANRSLSLPVSALLRLCYDMIGCSVHEFVSAEKTYVTLPNWAGATAALLGNRAIMPDTDATRWIKDWMAGRNEEGYSEDGDGLFYKGEEPISDIVTSRVLEIAEDRYEGNQSLYNGFKWSFLRIRTRSGPEAVDVSGTKPISLSLLIILSMLIDVPEDCLISRNYIRFLPAAIKGHDGTLTKLRNPLVPILERILSCTPEYRSKVLGKVWALSYCQ